MIVLIVVFILGVWVGYKYPNQVDQVVQSIRKIFGDIKDKVSKKPPEA